MIYENANLLCIATFKIPTEMHCIYFKHSETVRSSKSEQYI